MNRIYTYMRSVFLLCCIALICGCASEEGRWETAKTADTVEAYEAFLAEYPESPHQTEAAARIEALDWTAAENSDTIEGYQAFLEKHRESEHVGSATERIDMLEKTAIHRAAEQGDLEEVRSLLDGGTDVNTTEGAGATPLHIASGECRMEIVDLLIARGADVNQRGRDDSTPLHWAARAGCLPEMRRLIAAGADVNIAVRQPFSGYSVGEGGSVTYFSSYNPAVQGSALHWAVQYEQPEAAALLIKSGADVNFTTGWGMSPLHRAAEVGDEALVAMLLEQGARWHDEELKNGQPIHYASSKAIAEIFEGKGENPNVESVYRGRPIHTAAYLGHLEAVEHFLERGVGVDQLGSWNMDAGWTAEVTPLWAAAYGGNLNVLKLLESRGGDLQFNTEDGGLGGTLLHTAAWEGHDKVVGYLISKGLPVDALADMPTAFPLSPSWKDVTPLAIAAHFGHVEVLEVLVQAGADVNTVNRDDWSALELALVTHQKDAVEFLLDHGAKLDRTEEQIDFLNTSEEIKELLRERLKPRPTPDDLIAN